MSHSTYPLNASLIIAACILFSSLWLAKRCYSVFLSLKFPRRSVWCSFLFAAVLSRIHAGSEYLRPCGLLLVTVFCIDYAVVNSLEKDL